MKKTFTDEFREALINAGETRYQISRATGISESVLSRFCRSETGITSSTMDLIAEHLGLHVVAKLRRKTRRAKPKGT